jgi:flagellar biosynthesis/type III secretory pathway chaperone
MANNRDLLKEAIADAKAVKETAIANAKAALEEAFEPRIKSMLSAKLEEMEKEDMDEEIEEAVTNEAKEEVEERLGTINDPDSREPHGNLEEEEMDEEMDLDEILAELENLDEEKEDMDEAKDEMYEAEEGEEDEEAEDEEVEGEDEEIDLEEMSEEDLKKFIEDVIEDMVKAGELEAGDEFEDDVDVEVDAEGELEIEDDEETAVDEMINEEKEEVDEVIDIEAIVDKMGGAGKTAVKALIDALGKAIDYTPIPAGVTGKMEEGDDVDEMKKEIEELKSELNEINLLNAKLLYVNKIFKSKNLNEAKKAKVLEAFDKAKSAEEAKLIFETLSENLSAKKEVVKESLGRASKPMGVAPTAKKPILEANNQVARWQKLAGIIKS